MGDIVKKTNSQCGVNLYLTAFCLMTITMSLIIAFRKTTKVYYHIGRLYTRGHIICLDELGQTFVLRLVIRF